MKKQQLMQSKNELQQQQSNEQNEMSSCTWCGERARTKPTTTTTKLWMPILVRVNNILMCISCPNSIQIT